MCGAYYFMNECVTMTNTMLIFVVTDYQISDFEFYFSNCPCETVRV